MSDETRIWWDGNPVKFVRWTEKGLVFNWDDPRETAIHMPRGTVVRLMAKGVLEIEGDMPEWIYGGSQRVAQPVLQVDDDLPFEKVQFEKPKPAPPPKVPNKLNIIARLINKLGGGDPARATG